MSTVDFGMVGVIPDPVLAPHGTSAHERPLHRIRSVRLREGVSLRSAARHTGTDIRSLRLQEQESTDLRLSDLHRWQKALGVPISELVVETDEPLTRPVLDRARLVRVMKTAAAIHEQASSINIQRMAQMLVEQLVEIMPELKDVSPWHTFGQRRSSEEYGRVLERRVSDNCLCDDYVED